MANRSTPARSTRPTEKNRSKCHLTNDEISSGNSLHETSSGNFSLRICETTILVHVKFHPANFVYVFMKPLLEHLKFHLAKKFLFVFVRPLLEHVKFHPATFVYVFVRPLLAYIPLSDVRDPI